MAKAKYADFFLLPVPKRKLAVYRRMASRAGKIWREHGALEYREFVGEDLRAKGLTPFPKKVKLKAGEVLTSAVVGYRSRAHRDRVNERVMSDPRLKDMMKDPPPFD